MIFLRQADLATTLGQFQEQPQMRSVVVLIAFSLANSVAFATPIKFIHSSSGSGSINGVPFSLSAFTITALGDTANREQSFASYVIPHNSVTIAINGVGTFDFISRTRTFVNQSTGAIGFSRSGTLGADLLNGPTNSLNKSWDMLRAYGPISGIGRLRQWDLDPLIFTNEGQLFFESVTDINVTFQAIVPEPSAVALQTAGVVTVVIFVGLTAHRRRPRRIVG